MVKEIPAAGKSISRNGSFATFKKAQMWVVSVSMESMRFTFVTEKASIGREMQIQNSTLRDFASIWLQVRIQIFTNLSSAMRRFLR